MSGGFFRGTSADQDTRFSNKQAKLLKSQKFPVELDHPVDVSKVKMDVIKPWIANRVTQLLEFEDEVLINFIYGLLEGKVVDGKQIQIQLTGFMEKNTGKFMKELWGLLLSAQKNASGIPQQFLDAKEEELRKKKEETDRITNEIQKKREKEERESEPEQQKGGDAAADKISKGLSTEYSNEDKEADNGHNLGENRAIKFPLSSGRLTSPHHSGSLSPVRPGSKSLSHSRTYSRSKSLSKSPEQRRSISPDTRYRSHRRSRSPRRFISPRRRRSPRCPRSPLPRRRSPYSRRRSPTPSRYRSPSPRCRKSPLTSLRRSPSPYRHRSPSPVRRRSPAVHRKSPSPVSWSPSLPRRRAMSPSRRSPVRKSPEYRRRSPEPRSADHCRRSPIHPSRKLDSRRTLPRGRSPERFLNSSYQRRRSLSRETVKNGSGSKSPSQDGRDSRRSQLKELGHSNSGHRNRKLNMLKTSLRSPQRNPRIHNDGRHRGRSSSTEKFQSSPESAERKQKPISMKSRVRDTHASPRRLAKENSELQDIPRTRDKEDIQRREAKRSTSQEQKKHILMHEGVEYGPGRIESRRDEEQEQVHKKKRSSREEYGVKHQDHAISSPDDECDRDHEIRKSKERAEIHKFSTLGSDSDNGDTSARHGEKRKHKVEDYNHHKDDQTDDRKEAKKRRKEEKRLRKEERRRRREERHRRREERRSSKQKGKQVDTVTPPSDIGKDDSDAEYYSKKNSAKRGEREREQSGDSNGSEAEHKKLEIELRKKALESLRAKKATTHLSP